MSHSVANSGAVEVHVRDLSQLFNSPNPLCAVGRNIQGVLETRSTRGWISKGYGLDQGPVVLMIENYRSGLVWQLMRECPFIVTGLRRAGFTGGWLRSASPS